jgi:hypothetical protein
MWLRFGTLQAVSAVGAATLVNGCGLITATDTFTWGDKIRFAHRESGDLQAGPYFGTPQATSV